MKYDEEKFKDFRKHLMTGNGDFTVFFGNDYVAFGYGDGKMFPVGWETPDKEKPRKYKRTMGLVVMSQVFTLMASEIASNEMK